MARLQSAEALNQLAEELAKQRDPSKPCVTVCAGTGCTASGAVDVAEAFRKAIDERGLQDKVDLRATGCHGFCERGPLVVLRPSEIFYQRVTPKDVDEILLETVLAGNVIDRLLYEDPNTGEKIIKEPDVPFYKSQRRLLLAQNGYIDPTSMEDYLAIGGYSGLAKALSEMSPEQIVEEILRSGLRGRGGAGFPTGRKWQLCREQAATPKYIVCNADEGDPGAFQDRSLLEGNPHSVLEGLLIGGYAIGAVEGHIYVRTEYPLALKHIEAALESAREYGLLGENILGTGFSFDVKVTRGAGAFVCGEESALLASVEGTVGEPRPRPPYPAQSGLWGQPTVINNVKTWGSVPYIIRNGAEWFAGIGTEQSKGTMIFSLVGKVNNTGLVEVPMGITLKELVYEIGGGILDGREFKAVQTGGPSGGCIPADLIHLPVDYEQLQEVGSMMGSGGMVVMDEGTCMVDVARYFLQFTAEESCGKCTACRDGTQQMLEVLTRLCDGKGREGDVELLEEIGQQVKGASLCALGGTAPNPVLSTIRYFRNEYDAHVADKKCPAGVCRELISFSISVDKCNGCGACDRQCPETCIIGENGDPRRIQSEKCIKCGVCRDVCRYDAVIVE
ncbi:MAG: NADH-quinone oxidoreductase subunit NuoF [Armatimonadota bacterium]|jgi:NADH:ubiquinone oxidoreductase subunit F (NADH-binding)/(2Fe-2S) ferredoxin/NAD-dependent dihydropyrimidine dehydrogenase PreA subunit